MHHLPESLVSDWILNRRRLLLSGFSMTALPWLGACATGMVNKKPAFQADPFQLGVASGDPSPDGMVLWTRLAPAPMAGGGMPPETVEVAWEVATDPAMRRIVQRGVAPATPQLGHSVHVETRGLEPDRWYWYRFSVGDAQSPVGRTRTMPPAGTMPDKLRFAFVSCQHYEQGLFTAFDHLSREDLDLVIHLGDYIYEYKGIDKRVRKHAGDEIVSLEDYRNRYAQYKMDPMLQKAHAQCPWLVTWDDHEFDNNYAGFVSEEADVSPETFKVRRADAYQAFYENMPLRRRNMPQGPDMKLYRSVGFGRLAQFEVLDTRQYRTDQPNGDGNRPLSGDESNPDATLLGDKQERWLMSELLKSRSRWNVLAQQVMMARVDRKNGPEAHFSMDQWPGYEVSRKRLAQFLATRRIANPVVLTGDIHSNWVNDLKMDYDRPEEATIATEFVGTSISSGGNGADQSEYGKGLLRENPFVRFYNHQRGYVRCLVTPESWRSDYQVVDYVDRSGAPLLTRGSFVIENGRPGAQIDSINR